MSLRQAKLDDHWRHIFNRGFRTKFTEVSIKNLSSFTDITVNFSAGLNAIVGGNGVGKSTLIAAIAQLLEPDPNSGEQGYNTRLDGSTIAGIAFSNEVEQHLLVHNDRNTGKRVHSNDLFTGEYRWLDPSALASECLHQIHLDQNFNDLLQPLTPLKLAQKELQIASYLVGKDYADIEIYEIAEYEDPFPYFRVSSGGITYGSEGMGRGELSLLLTYWTLQNMSRDSVLLLEEPETHVSPRSQDSLMNIVAKFSDEMGLWVIVTTHSPTVIRNIPPEHLKLLVRHQGQASLVNATKLDIALLLGGGVAYSGVILVEDETARRFVITVFEAVAPEMLRQIEIINARGSAGISAALQSLPLTRNWLALAGVYDGDLRGHVTGDGFKWPFDYLPGIVAPENLPRTHGAELPEIVTALSTELKQSADRIRMALDHSTGVDNHDYFGQIAAVLNVDIGEICKSFTRVWLHSDRNLEEARNFVDRIRAVITRD